MANLPARKLTWEIHIFGNSTMIDLVLAKSGTYEEDAPLKPHLMVPVIVQSGQPDCPTKSTNRPIAVTCMGCPSPLMSMEE